MAALFTQRLHFFVGKGGVGKTTIATAVARATARRGQKTLLIELDGNTRAARLLGLPADDDWTHTPRHVSPTLSVLALSGQAALEEYLQLILPATRFLRVVFHSQLYQYFVAAAPGLKELLMMGKIWYEAHKTTAGTQQWDRVIVDTPATGHSLQYLQMPWTARDTFQGGLVQRETERIVALLRDAQQTAVHFVTTPEELSVSETLAAYQRLVNDQPLPLGCVFINRRHTAPLRRTRLTRARIDAQTSAHARQLSEQILARAEAEAQLSESQAACVKKLQAIPLPTVQLPFCFTESFCLAEVERLSQIIEASLTNAAAPTSRAAATAKRRSRRSGPSS